MIVERIDPTVLSKFPCELSNVEYKEFLDGQIRVYKNGRIFRINQRGIVEAPQHKTGRTGKYLMISVMKNGKQRYMYVHRLMAKGFIPNPENKPHVNHLDGNPRNNQLNNLEWVTPRENVEHAYQTGLIRTLENTPHKCIRCKGPSMNESEVCAECKSNLKDLKSSLISKQKQRDLYRNIDINLLKPLYKRIIKSRFQCFTLESIGKELGYTREYIRQLEARVMNKDPIVFKEGTIKNKSIIKQKPNLLKDFKITLRAARINTDLSIVKVGETINKSPTTITKWEKGESKIPVCQFEKLINLYQTPLSLLSFKINGSWIILKEDSICS